MKTGITLIMLYLCMVQASYAQNNNFHEDTSKFIIQDNILVKTPDGASISVLVARKKEGTQPLPAILQFTIYARPTDYKKAVDAASRGYIGVMAYSRGKRYSTDTLMPYEHDGADCDAVINWIATQPWSNGKVGMYGGSYNGYTQWAATKHLPKALKTIVPSAPVAPGRDAPLAQGVIMSFPFSWTYYVSNNAFLDEADYGGSQWRDLNWKWYRSGIAYRNMDSLLGRGPNRIFRRWMEHPDYDSYWQRMIPYKEEFSDIHIPILFTTGYYDGCQTSALYYYREHHKYYPGADDYMLIGPYGHFGSQGYPDSVYCGYTIDPVANIPIHEIIFQWFDHILKGGPLPPQLKDRINYAVMGSNTWEHAPTLQAMASDTLHFYLGSQQPSLPVTNINASAAKISPSVANITNYSGGNLYQLSKKPDNGKSTKVHNYHLQMIDFRDRETLNSYYYQSAILYDTLDATGGLVFLSDPLTKPTTITGNFFGNLHLSINKKDMDYSVVLFEQTPDGKLFYLSYFMGRASYTHSIEKRQLLTPGKDYQLPFSNTYLTARKLSPGSRIMIIINVNKSPFEQINYGTGKDVSDETIQDAGQPLQVKWYNDSRISIPVHR